VEAVDNIGRQLVLRNDLQCPEDGLIPVGAQHSQKVAHGSSAANDSLQSEATRAQRVFGVFECVLDLCLERLFIQTVENDAAPKVMESFIAGFHKADYTGVMRAVVQRVSSARVLVEGECISVIGRGLLVLLGIAKGDGEGGAAWMAEKLAMLRIFEDPDGKINFSLGDISGEMLLVSNFTVCGSAQKGRRPSFDEAAPFEQGRATFESVVSRLREQGVRLQLGVYGAEMAVELSNDGPVTLVIDSPPIPQSKRSK
jgi:D-tyrosyl-tRNA(Tyr) deacylase